ncbi:SDR family oxidoreductase [Olsenella sp. An270]|uniref:SDR family oxidoreductase n=1 Tax=Olsenella sp. An270 TaxID=1965615 RepID=UPI000B3868B5|nr:SDR family oxidoreductase [Olsenella sp. An270]OUO60904.1 hypothetical protein B5F73_01250 [Olsenella sp. An270]
MDIGGLFGLEGKNVVVTGAGSGMGRAASRLLAELGANVYATVRRHPLDFPVKREIPSELGTREGLDALVAELPPVIDALFVCHGISNSVGMTNGLEVQLTNFLSFRYLTEALLPRMSEGSSVTFISSNGGWEWRERAAACMELIETAGWDEALAWYASHPELTNDGYVFAKQCQNVYVYAKVHDPAFVSRHVRINAIAPGLTKTGLTDDFNRSLTGDAAFGQSVLEDMYLSTWNGRWATPEEMGYPMVVLGSRLCSYVSGQVLYIDWGSAAEWELETILSA